MSFIVLNAARLLDDLVSYNVNFWVQLLEMLHQYIYFKWVLKSVCMFKFSIEDSFDVPGLNNTVNDNT